MIVEHFKEMNIQKVGPTHCIGKEAEALFREEYKDNFLSIKAGQIIEV
jgi:metal-dependent hydrolase (beta-lactamase superfamily II)